jgi:hypothetical protein
MKYQYQLTDMGNGTILSYIMNNSSTSFRFSWVTNIRYNRTYSIVVRAYVSGAWQAYGSSCNVSTPASIPTTQIQPATCGTTLAAVSTTMNCVAVDGAKDYQYHVTDGMGFDAYYKRTSNATDFRLSWVPGTVVNHTYNIQVRAWDGAAWGPFGASCSVTTGPVPRMAGEPDETEYILNVFPNPVSENEFNLTLENAEQPGEMTVEIYNTMGVKVKYAVTNFVPGEEIKIPFGESITNGVYFLTATVNDKKIYSKFVVAK